MNWIFIGFFIPTCILYINYSRGEKSFLNALSGLTLIKIVNEFILEPLAFNFKIFDYKTETFFYLYLASFVGYLMLIIGARRSRSRLNISITQNRTIVPTIVPWIFYIFSFLLYLPILISFRDYLLDPRFIYEKTRTGYGIEYFGSALLANCSLILFLFSKRRFHILFMVFLIAFTLLKGSKGQVLTIIFIYIIWLVYVRHKKFNLKKTVLLILVIPIIMIPVFILNSHGQTESIFLSLATYSDYNRNASLILDDSASKIYFGKITLENFIYSKIPRIIWPEKPKNFGEFLLSENYFPEQFKLYQGAPSFGLGVYFADFGFFAYLFIGAVNFFTGRMLRYFIRLNERHSSIFNFLMILFFANIEIFPVGVGYFLIEYLIFAYILQKVVTT